jgi:hypothetical protein
MTDTTQALTVPEARPRPAMTTGGTVGALIPRDIEQAFRIASALAQSGMTPNGFKTPETCFVAIMAGAELGLPPFQSLQSFAIINNRPTLWGDALMAVVRTNGFKVREWMEGEGEAMTAFCEVTRPDNGDVAEESFSVDDAKTAGLWKKAGPWQSAPKRMLKMRARSFAIRDGAADVLRGFQIREEVEDYGDPIPADNAAKPGTGLLARLETTQTLATEGFGIRNLADEAGEAAPAAEPAPKARKRTNKAIADEALAAIAEAEPEIVAQVVADHVEVFVFADAENGDDAFPGDAPADPENLPADAQVEETGAATPEPTQPAQTVIDGPAPSGVRYFLADKEAFPSGRRVVFVDGQSEKEAIDDTPDVPVYTAHPVAGPSVAPTTDAAFDEAPAADAEPATAFDTFNDALEAATDVEGLTAALRALFTSGECATPDDKRGPRCKVWARVRTLNEDGAKIAPESDPFILGCYIEAETDVEAVQAVLPLARDQAWFAEGGEGMQAGVGRAVMDRVKVLKGGS